MTTELTEEGWTAEDLNMCSLRELRELADDTGLVDYRSRNVTKAELVALLLGEEPPVPSPETLLREVERGARWVRGVPPPHACLKAEDKLWLDRMLSYSQVA